MVRRWRLAACVWMLHAAAAAAGATISPAKAARELGRARELADAGRTEQAVAALVDLLSRAPDLADAHLLYIDVRSRTARAVVRSEYEQRLGAEPESGLLHLAVGYATDEPRRKRRLYRKAVELDPRLYRGWVELARLLRAEPMADAAASVAAAEQAVALRPGSAGARVELGRSLAFAGRRAEAEATLRRATELGPESEDAWAELVRVIRASSRDTRPDAPASGREAATPQRRGESRARDALQALQRGLSACRRSGRLWWALADLFWAQGRYAEAERPLECALRYGERSDFAAEASRRLAARYLMRGHHRSASRLGAEVWAEAIAEMAARRLSGEAFRLCYEAEHGGAPDPLARLERARVESPTSAVVLRALAARCLAAGRSADAARAFTALCSLRPGDVDARSRCAAALVLAGDAAGAARLLARSPAQLPREAGWVLADAEAVAAGELPRAAFAARYQAGGDPEKLRACIARFPSYLTPRVELAGILRADGRASEAKAALDAAADVAGPAAVDADRHALLGAQALEGLYFAKAIDHYRRAIALQPKTPRHHEGLARACVERGEFGPARDALERLLELAPESFDVGDPPEREGEGWLLEPRLEPGDVLLYRYTTDGGVPRETAAEVGFRYVVEAVQPGGLVEATLEVTEVGGRPVEGGRDFAKARLAVTCSNVFGLVDVGQPPGGPPREFAQLLWLVQFLHGPALPTRRWPGQRWREAAWAELGRLYAGVVHFERVRRGRAYLTKSIEYEKPANGVATAFEVMAVKGWAEQVFDLRRRVLVQVDVTTNITLRDGEGNEAQLPPWKHRLELRGVERGVRETGQRRVVDDVPYIRQVGPKCAAAALGMVLRHFGRKVDQEELFRQLHGHSGGVHVHAMPEAARRHRFEAHPHIGSLDSLRRQLDAGVPVIVFLTPMGMGHAVVAIGYDDARREIILHDPATAPFKRVSLARFEREWGESDRTCIAVVPARDPRFAHLDYPRQSAVEAMLGGDRLFSDGRLEQAEAAYRRALEQFAGYTEAHLALVRNLVAQERLADAMAEAERLIADRPDHLAAQIAKADILVLQRRYADAVAVARRVEMRDPTNLRNLNVLATAYIQSARRAEAVAVLRRAVRMAPAWTNVRARLAALYVAEGRYDSAVEQYRAALDHEPRNAAVHFLLAQTLHQSLREDRRREMRWARRRQHAADAAAALQAVRDIEGPSCEASAELAQLYGFLGNDAESIRQLRRAVREPTLRQLRQPQGGPRDADPLSFVSAIGGALKDAVGRLTAWAESQRQRATDLNNLAWAYATRGERLAEARGLAARSVALRQAGFNLDTLAWIDLQLGRREAALAAFERAVALQPDPVVHIHLGLTLIQLGQRARGEAEIAKAFALGQAPVEVHLELADACAQLGLGDRELAALDAAVAADPRHRLARYRLALALLARGRDLPRVEAVAEALYAADTADPLYAGLLGAVCHLEGRALRARALLAKAVADDPLLGPEPVAPYRCFLGLALMAAGERDRAVAELRRCLDAAPAGPFAPRAKAALRQIGP